MIETVGLAERIQLFYGTGGSLSSPAMEQPSKESTDAKLGLKAPHFSTINELDKYISESNEWTPIRYFKHKEDETKRLVIIASPYKDTDDIMLQLPEKPHDPYLKQMISTWKEIQHVVMMDQEMLELIYQMGDSYGTRLPMIIEGPPARSKTFAAWVFSTIIETPYARMTCSSGTRESYLLGSLQPSRERVGLYTIRDVLTNPAVLQRVRLCEKAKESKDSHLSFNDQAEISDFLTSIETLLELEKLEGHLSVVEGQEVTDPNPIIPGKVNLDDPRVLMAYDIITRRTGIQLVGETKYEYVDSKAVRVYEGGGIAIFDEFNTISDDGVQANMLPMLEARNSSFVVSSQRNPPAVKKHNDFFAIITMNPPNTIGRRQLGEPTISRTAPTTLGPVTEEYVKNIIDYFLTGNDPDIRMKEKLVQGRKNVSTPFRALEDIPYRDLVIQAITRVHTTMDQWVTNKTIGAARREGGFYVIDQRKVTAVLDLMLRSYNHRFVETAAGLAQVDPDWVAILKSALHKVYESGVKGEILDPDSDRAKVHALIEGLPIWDKLRPDRQSGAPLTHVTTAGGKPGMRPAW